MDNATVVLSQFISAKEAATPHFVAPAPLFPTTDTDYSMKQVIDAIAEQQDFNNKSHFYSFSTWTDGHASEHHEAATALYVEYENERVAAVERHLAEMGLAYFTFPTLAGRKKVTGFAFPLDAPIDYSAAMRAIALIVESIAVGGVVEYSFLPTYFFRFQKAAHCKFVYQDRSLWGRYLNEGLGKLHANVQQWVA